jgi:hypothetical protein
MSLYLLQRVLISNIYNIFNLLFSGILEASGNSSFFFSSLDSRDTKIVNLPTIAAAGETTTDAEDDETIKVRLG